ncbi:MAG: hypothetical protein IH991_19905 [Planctomycetes bacterium]|nr:hypothetical protein [Planctomycetota bacterium]
MRIRAPEYTYVPEYQVLDRGDPNDRATGTDNQSQSIERPRHQSLAEARIRERKLTVKGDDDGREL